MQKISLFLIIVCFLSCGLFSCFFPYPILSNYTNLNAKNIYEINTYNEAELTAHQNSEKRVLDLMWKDINPLFENDIPYELIALHNNSSFFAVRTGGTNHADIEPASSEEKQSMEQFFTTNEWKCYPVLLKLNENTFIPASLSSYPHGYQTLNTSSGHFCLHFKNSKTHKTNLIDQTNQDCIKEATKKGKIYIKQEQ
ncbi:MAG: hypothetical protein J6J24_02020 [Clostridia bacterium]|nr:hypothetical protein [Clostridia bacterium]